MYNFNMQRFFLILGIYLLILPSSSAVEVTSITEIPEEVHIQVGSRLLIPCHFNTDTRTHNSKTEMEWGRIPLEGGSFKPYVYTYNPDLLEYYDSRAQVFPNHLRHGNCSLVIDSVRQEDEGLFELRLGVDGNSYEPYPFLTVRVSEDYGQENETDQNRILSGVNKYTIKYFLAHPDLKKRPTFTTILITGGVFMALGIAGSLALSIYLVIRRRRKIREDELKQAEEGRASPNSMDSTMVSPPPSYGSGSPSPSSDSTEASYKTALSELP